MVASLILSFVYCLFYLYVQYLNMYDVFDSI